MSFIELAKNRYSVRKFSNRPIEKEKLDTILAVGNLAPTAKNMQPQRIYVLQSDGAIAELDSLTPCRYGANTVLLFTYNVDEEWQNPFENNIRSGVQDVSIVATHIMLAAKEQGLDTCWCDYFPNSKLEDAFYLPKNEKAVLLMPIGYADESAKPSQFHNSKKDIDQIVKYL